MRHVLRSGCEGAKWVDREWRGGASDHIQGEGGVTVNGEEGKEDVTRGGGWATLFSTYLS